MPSTPSSIVTNHFLWNKNQVISKYHEPKWKNRDFWLFTPFLRHNLCHLYKWWKAEILWEWKVSPQDSSHQIWYQYLLNFGCGMVLSHFHATFTPFYANQGISGVRSPSNFEKHVKTHHHAKFHAFLPIWSLHPYLGGRLLVKIEFQPLNFRGKI